MFTQYHYRFWSLKLYNRHISKFCSYHIGNMVSPLQRPHLINTAWGNKRRLITESLKTSVVVWPVRAGTPCHLKTECGVCVPAKLCPKCDPPKEVHYESIWNLLNWTFGEYRLNFLPTTAFHKTLKYTPCAT
jgi:hypothetical protein